MELLLDILFPKNIRCILCNDEIFRNQKYSLCKKCRNKLTFLKGENCKFCSREIFGNYNICIECEKKKFYFKKGISVLLYDKYAKKMIIKLKYGKKRYISNYFSGMIYDKIIKRDTFNFDYITYVPISKRKYLKRGFNQSKLIAKNLARLTNKRLINVLKKIEDTPDMKELGKSQREKYIRGVFKINDDFKKVENVLIVDDVFTTGTTLNECSKVLYENGIKNIYIATVAVGEIKD